MPQFLRKCTGLAIAISSIAFALSTALATCTRPYPRPLSFATAGSLVAGSLAFCYLGVWLFRYPQRSRKLLYFSLISTLLAVALLWAGGLSNESRISLRDIPGISNYSLSKNGTLYKVNSISRTSEPRIYLFDITPTHQSKFKEHDYLFDGNAAEFNEVVREFEYLSNRPSVAKNILSTTKQWGINLITGIYEIVRHPIHTAKGLGDLVKKMPSSISSSVSEKEWINWYKSKIAEKAEHYHIDPNAIVLNETRLALQREVDVQISTINAANLIALIIPGIDAGKAVSLLGEAGEEGAAVAETASVTENAAKEGNIGAETEKAPETGTHHGAKNKAEGLARERAFEQELRDQYPISEGYKIEKERYLYDKNGNLVRDPLTGEARRVDFVVIKDGEVLDSVEVTSEQAPKDVQMAKETRIREQGGNYVKDEKTGELIPFKEGVNTRVVRMP